LWGWKLVVKPLGSGGGLAGECLDGNVTPGAIETVDFTGSGAGSKPELQDLSLALLRILPCDGIERAQARHFENGAIGLGVRQRPGLLGFRDEDESFREATKERCLHHVYSVEAVRGDGREWSFVERAEIH